MTGCATAIRPRLTGNQGRGEPGRVDAYNPAACRGASLQTAPHRARAPQRSHASSSQPRMSGVVRRPIPFDEWGECGFNDGLYGWVMRLNLLAIVDRINVPGQSKARTYACRMKHTGYGMTRFNDGFGSFWL